MTRVKATAATRMDDQLSTTDSSSSTRRRRASAHRAACRRPAWQLAALAAAATMQLAAAGGASPAATAEATGAARKSAEALFDKYVELEHAFDPAIADLYADDAHIVSRKVYPDRPAEVRTYPASRYKQQLRRVMPIAKRNHDVSFYTAMTYTREGNRVRIKATRYAELKKFVSPLELLVGPGPGGTWLIYEELSEARP
ncbi:MAG TPA: hypothetical protein VHR45_07955 [Thermoanaerobaculia bacterium]|nr:hypothetical protein [Thermoanaerobaculia bacterium]